MKNTNIIVEEIVKWIKASVLSAGCKGVVFGMSGGIDSAVIANLCIKAFPETSLGVMIPCNSSLEDEEDAVMISKEIGLKVEKVDITATYNTFLEALGEFDFESSLNLKPRLRMSTLYYMAQKNNYLVVGSTNRSEFMTGYFTKYGDSGVDILPIATFVKKEIYELARELKINEKIINKIPSAGLKENQSDEEEMGILYEDLDNYLNGNKLEKKEIESKIDGFIKKSEHKRKYPIIFDIEKKL